MQKVLLYFQSYDFRTQSNTQVCELMCSFGSVCVSVPACFHWCLNLLYQDKVDYTNPLYCLSPFTSHAFLFPFHIILLFSEKVRTEKRQMKGVDGLLLRFYSNSDLNYIKNVVGVYLYF